MGKFIDLTGQTFGRLTVIERVENDKWGMPRWRCLCECGHEIITLGSLLRLGKSRSCGCLKKQLEVKRQTTHGLSGSRIFNIWVNMRQRCFNPNSPAYNRYGGRGIQVCNEWLNLGHFYGWAMDNGYTDELTIDRINNDGDYEPGNCRWVNMKTQANNTKNNVRYDGKTIAEWSEKTGIKQGTIRYRIVNSGWTLDDAVTTQVRGR